jgi:putative flippase GtrA
MKSLLSPKPGMATTGKTGENPKETAAPGALASFVRFVVCGGGIGVLSSAAVPLLATLMPWVAANALITIASTVLCTELHALFTFGTGRRPGWREHWQSAGSATAAYAATSAAILVLHAVQPSPGMLTEQTVYLSASALAGIGRFLVLRLFVFADKATPTAAIKLPVLPTSVSPAFSAAA